MSKFLSSDAHQSIHDKPIKPGIKSIRANIQSQNMMEKCPKGHRIKSRRYRFNVLSCIYTVHVTYMPSSSHFPLI